MLLKISSTIKGSGQNGQKFGPIVKILAAQEPNEPVKLATQQRSSASNPAQPNYFTLTHEKTRARNSQRVSLFKLLKNAFLKSGFFKQDLFCKKNKSRFLFKIKQTTHQNY